MPVFSNVTVIGINSVFAESSPRLIILFDFKVHMTIIYPFIGILLILNIYHLKVK